MGGTARRDKYRDFSSIFMHDNMHGFFFSENCPTRMQLAV